MGLKRAVQIIPHSPIFANLKKSGFNIRKPLLICNLKV